MVVFNDQLYHGPVYCNNCTITYCSFHNVDKKEICNKCTLQYCDKCRYKCSHFDCLSKPQFSSFKNFQAHRKKFKKEEMTPTGWLAKLGSTYFQH